MIRKIQRIKSFGVFADFRWPAELPVFNRYNLVYGWNYSGKTTVSRIFRCFETGHPHPDFQGAEVKLESEDGTVHDLAMPAGTPHIRLFNSEFIHENLSFDDCHATPILILGQEDIKRQEELDIKRKSRDDGQRDQIQKKAQKIEIGTTIESAKTSKARDIKQTLSLPNYDKTRLGPQIAAVADEPEKHLLSDDTLANALATYRSREKKPLLTEQTVRIKSLSKIVNKGTELLAKTVVGQTIKRLEENAEIEQWVRTGWTLHEGKHTCEFCGGTLPSDLMMQLSHHFSSEYENLMTELETTRQEVEAADSETLSLDDDARFYAELVNEYTLLRKKIEALLQKRSTSLKTLTVALREKKKKAFKRCDCPTIVDPSDEINSLIESMNAIIRRHNLRTNEFEEKRTEALMKIEKHYAAQFVIDQQYSQKQKQIKELDADIGSLDIQLKTLADEIKKLELELSEAKKGAEQINRYLFAYFGKNDLRIEVTPEKRFQFNRGDIRATNLSEGEKTAISFAYFLTRLSDRSTNLAETIVIIDDPVSSLDANHLFNTVALIKTKLADCKQLTILTHNYEFFNLIRDWFMDIEKTSDMKKHKDLQKWRSFFIESVSQRESTIREIPWELISFKSEYHYLFSVLYNFDAEPKSEFSTLFNLPNITRRYMEAFGGIMIPSFAGLQKKMKKLFPDGTERERVWKFINYYSHNTTINRSLTIPDNSECKAVVASCLKVVRERYHEHYDALVEAIT